jgi:hypothetical protein
VADRLPSVGPNRAGNLFGRPSDLDAMNQLTTQEHPSVTRSRPRRRSTFAAVLVAGAGLVLGTIGSASTADARTISGESVQAAVVVPTTFPTATGSVKQTSTKAISGTFDGGLKRFYGIGDGSQDESQDPMFTVADGGTIKNVIIGVPAGDGIHCLGTCTIQNVWWEDVGEDAATQKGTKTGQVMTIDGGGAQKASDKVFQHNGPGTMVIKNFLAKDIGKLYRSCGNCKTQFKRTVIVQNVTVVAPAKVLVGINTNFGDKATLSGITIQGDTSKKVSICDRFTGNSSGAEPVKTGSGADGTFCVFTAADIIYK